MVYSVSPEFLQQAQEVGKHVRLEVTKNIKKGEVKIRFMAKDAVGEEPIANLVNNVVTQLCSQFYTYFGIQGEIIELE